MGNYMKSKYLNKLVSAILLVLLIALGGELAYMNLRGADPILAGWEDYNATVFNTRTAEGERQLVEVYASWCPTCLLQHQAFEAMIAEGKRPQIRAIRVDYDRDSAFRAKFGITATGELLILERNKIVARATGLVTPASITAFLQQNDVALTHDKKPN